MGNEQMDEHRCDRNEEKALQWLGLLDQIRFENVCEKPI
jgi:hypothetical protein